MRKLASLAVTGCLFSLVTLACGRAARAEICNLKVVTDASPDYTDMGSMIHSITAKWPSTQEKCWAMWYWNHLARRQTAPMVLHGLACSDPIRQFNDYGYMMCSTIAGANCAIWHNMGLKVKYWDVVGHTVPEVWYDDRWHMYDDSMSAIYTLCDGKTIAGVEDIGKEGAARPRAERRSWGTLPATIASRRPAPTAGSPAPIAPARSAMKRAVSIPNGSPIAPISMTGTGGTAMS